MIHLYNCVYNRYYIKNLMKILLIIIVCGVEIRFIKHLISDRKSSALINADTDGGQSIRNREFLKSHTNIYVSIVATVLVHLEKKANIVQFRVSLMLEEVIQMTEDLCMKVSDYRTAILIFQIYLILILYRKT